jgi:hypothetical protein
VAKDVALADTHMGPDLAAEFLRASCVDVYPLERALELTQGEGDCAVAGAPLDDQSRSGGDEFYDPVDDYSVGEEVLCEFVATFVGIVHDDSCLTMGAGQHKAPPGRNRVGGANVREVVDPRRYGRRVRSIIVKIPMP